MEGSSVRVRQCPYRERALRACNADAMTRYCHEMSLCNTYRSFAIYLVIVFIISESPVSAFTVRRMRTTTLKSITDLASDESALLEIKSDLSKLNNERDNIKHVRNNPTRKSVNFLTQEKTIAFDSRKTAAVPTRTISLDKKEEPKIRSNDTTTKGNTEIDTGLTETEAKKLKIDNYLRKDKTAGKLLSRKSNYPSSKTVNYFPTKKTVDQTELTEKKVLDNSTSTKTALVKDDSISKSTEPFTTTEKTTIKTTSTESPTVTNKKIISTTFLDEKNYDSTEITPVELSLSYEYITDTDTKSPQTEENTVTYSTELTESMIREPSKASTKNPSWKNYTVIERKRIVSTTEEQPTSTEKTEEELEKAESVSSRITLDNAISVTPIHSIEELQHGLSSDTKLETMHINDNDNVVLTTQPATKVLETEITQSPSTKSMEKDITTESKMDFVESRRAGYLDFSAKISTINEEKTTTDHYVDSSKNNKTDLIESMFDKDTQEDGPEVKNTATVQSHSQMADDVLKEELLKEEVLNDNAENSERLEEQDLNKVKPLTDSTDEPLSVKPINNGKGALYTVNSNYRKMKKIEVQPYRPFVRDPDDNSWRNESLTSLGIVFKAKNASKPFTQVLKNKTEAELNNIIQVEKDNTNEVPDLRQRLEKIAEVRKSRKKKIDKFGETVYSDYEETSGEVSSTPKTSTESIPIMDVIKDFFSDNLPTTPSPATQASTRSTTPEVYMFKEETSTTRKPKKINKFPEYYDTTDEYDADYINLSKIDLKKFTTRLFAKDVTTATTSPMFNPITQPIKIVPLPERKPTIQYFPPRDQPRQNVNVNDYDDNFQKKVNFYMEDKTPKDASPVTYSTLPPTTLIQPRPAQYARQKPAIPMDHAYQYKPANLDKNVYVTFPPRVADHGNKYPGNNDESFDRASYVIKHYKDLIDEAVKADYDKRLDFVPPFTEAPLTGVTMIKEQNPIKHFDDDYDDDAHFRKDIINRFVDNFNQNSERFKVDFPILYNNTVVHRKALENGKVVASSSAFMRRLYGDPPMLRTEEMPKPCEPHCEVNLELSPTYELQYYLPDQEEKEEAELKPDALPFTYRL